MLYFDLYSTLGFLFVNTGFQAKQNLTVIFQKEGFSTTIDQFVVMSALFGTHGITQKQICDKCGKNRSNLTRLLRRMENTGLITRQKGYDGRSRYVYLSEEGRELFISLAPIAVKYMAQVLGDLSDDEKDLLTKLVFRIREKL